SGIYLNCGVFGALLIPLNPQRCNKVRSETVKLLEQKDSEAVMFENSPITKEIEFNSRNNLSVLEQEKVDSKTRVSVLFLNNVGLTVSACTAVTRPILLGELLGLENVNNAYGLMLKFPTSICHII
ncbi:hypothetical protein DAPPUDRAFT_255244, partial [Daphnia pulex]